MEYNWNVKIIEKQSNGDEVIHENIKEQSFPIEKIKKSLEKYSTRLLCFDQCGSQVSENLPESIFYLFK